MAAPEYTGKEKTHDQLVSVWVLDPPLGTSFDELWFRSRDDAIERVEDEYHDLLERLHFATEGDGGSLTINIERREVTAEEAAVVFDR